MTEYIIFSIEPYGIAIPTSIMSVKKNNPAFMYFQCTFDLALDWEINGFSNPKQDFYKVDSLQGTHSNIIDNCNCSLPVQIISFVSSFA